MAEVKSLDQRQIDLIAGWILDQLGTAVDYAGGIFKDFSLVRLYTTIMFLAGAVEAAVAKIEGAGGQDKKRILVVVLNRLIDIPLLSERMEAWAIGLLIDQAVEYLNKSFGKSWLDQYEKTAGRLVLPYGTKLKEADGEK